MKNLLIPAAVLALALAGCGSEEKTTDQTDAAKQTLTVLAASSLTETFTELAKEFEADHKNVTVKLVFDSSSTLAEMAAQQAPGDVLATADKKTMDKAEADGGVNGDAEQFASNVVVLAVPADNPAKLTGFAGLQADGVDFLTCVTTAPCGAAAKKLLADNSITHKAVSQEVDVKAVLQKVEADEADAGLVYATDVTAAGDKVKSFPVPGADASPNTYWVGITAGAENDDLAAEWIDLLTGSEGQAVLKKAGFGGP